MRTTITAALAVMIGATGCATKQFVNKRVDPVSQRVDALETASQEQGTDLEEVERLASRADERAQGADSKAVAAAAAAKDAQARAEEADGAAARAQSAAERALGGVDALGNRIDHLEDYRLVVAETVRFGLGSSELSEEGRANLDAAVKGLASGTGYVVEVLGYTDTTGSPALNLELSRKRAQAVVRYLTVEHKIPLHRIHTIGLGSEEPAADNATREGREANRRVEVRVYAGDPEALSAEKR